MTVASLQVLETCVLGLERPSLQVGPVCIGEGRGSLCTRGSELCVCVSEGTACVQMGS